MSKDRLKTIFFLIPAISIYTIVCGSISLLSTLVDRTGDFAHRCARVWAWLILWTSGVSVTVTGLPLRSRQSTRLRELATGMLT